MSNWLFDESDLGGRQSAAAQLGSLAAVDDGPFDVLPGKKTKLKVLQNDEGTKLKIAGIGDAPDHGTVQIKGKKILYTADPDAAPGSDSFTYEVTGKNGGSDDATVSLNILAGNDARNANGGEPPDAVDDGPFDVAQGQKAKLNVLKNDEGTKLKITDILSGPAKGEVQIKGKKLIYTADADAAPGSDSFTYRVTDKNGETDDATVSLNILADGSGGGGGGGGDPAPVANPDEFTVPEDKTSKLNVLQNDTGKKLKITDIIEGPSLGTVEIKGKKLIYTAATDGEDTFTYEVQDKSGQTATAQVTVHVTDTDGTGGGGGGGTPGETIEGDDGDNNLVGTEGDDRILAKRGNDTLDGRGGDDFLDGGLGVNVFTGGSGRDTFFAGPTDTLTDFDPTPGTGDILDISGFIGRRVLGDAGSEFIEIVHNSGRSYTLNFDVHNDENGFDDGSMFVTVASGKSLPTDAAGIDALITNEVILLS